MATLVSRWNWWDSLSRTDPDWRLGRWSKTLVPNAFRALARLASTLYLNATGRSR